MSELEKTELEKKDSEKTELEKFKERHSLEKLEGVMIYDKPKIKTGEKAGCIGALLLLLGFGTGIILFLVHFIFDFDSKLLNLLWESIAALGFIFSLAGAFQIGPLTIHRYSREADKDKHFEIDRAYNLYNVLYKPTKTVLLQYDSDEDQLIAVNAGGELLVELLRKVEMEKLSLKKILKTFRLNHVSDHLWRLTYSYKKEEVVMEKSDR
ncbi:MAG: hypothetical protein HXO89_01285 [Streptococcus parasanguinis]|nr:hypothetical protein [Streptococcus parasanguinis]